MASELEIKKMELQLKKIDAAKAELEYTIAERKEDIRRMEAHIELQNKNEMEIREKLKQAKGE